MMSVSALHWQYNGNNHCQFSQISYRNINSFKYRFCLGWAENYLLNFELLRHTIAIEYRGYGKYENISI